MDPITLIVTALGAGVAGHAAAEVVLAEYQAAPATWEAPLAAKLRELGAGDDADILAAAQALLGAIGKYSVTISDSQGVQVGDHNVQINRFGA
jgi:hypothetical protein